MTKIYELTYIISSGINSEQAEAESKNVESFVRDKNGVILKSEKPSPRTLAYPIQRHGSGFFGVLEFQLEAEHLSELGEKLQKDDKIIRHMIVIKNPIKIQKERRVKRKPSISQDTQSIPDKSLSAEIPKGEKQKEKKIRKNADLKEIEKELDEILSE